MSTDPKMGKMIHEYLYSLGIETPAEFANLFGVGHVEDIKGLFRDIMMDMGLDLKDDSLQETPLRVAKMFCYELFWGLSYANFPKCTTVENKMGYDELVVVRDIEIKSMCEHHWQPIVGKAFIGYLPQKKVLGLSKFNRVANFFSRRPQVQERLTVQIYHALEKILESSDVAVVIKAEHFCVKMRGVEDFCSDTVTSKMGGRFMQKPELREEFLKLMTV